LLTTSKLYANILKNRLMPIVEEIIEKGHVVSEKDTAAWMLSSHGRS
jgi:hypothetical protein